jgi:hypothetical protein
MIAGGIDLAVALSHDTAGRVIGKLGEAFYADPSAIAEAVTHRSSFNVIHLATARQGNLDRADLEEAAGEFGLTDLLHRAIREAGIADAGST